MASSRSQSKAFVMTTASSLSGWMTRGARWKNSVIRRSMSEIDPSEMSMIWWWCGSGSSPISGLLRVRRRWGFTGFASSTSSGGLGSRSEPRSPDWPLRVRPVAFFLPRRCRPASRALPHACSTRRSSGSADPTDQVPPEQNPRRPPSCRPNLTVKSAGRETTLKSGSSLYITPPGS